MSDELTLFAVPESPSPRLKWLRKHDLTLRQIHASRWECVFMDDIGRGETADDAVVDLCIKTGLKHWNET